MSPIWQGEIVSIRWRKNVLQNRPARRKEPGEKEKQEKTGTIGHKTGRKQ